MKHDIELSQLNKVYVITPLSAVGMVWLQCHFPMEEWDWLCFGASCIDAPSAAMLVIDAEDAGLSILLSSKGEAFIPGLND